MFKLFPNFSIFTGGSGCCLRLASAQCQKYSFAAKVAINYSVYTATHGRECCCWAGVDAVVPRDPAVKCQRLYLETTITMLASHSSKLLWLHRLDNCQFSHLTSLKYSFVPLLCGVRLSCTADIWSPSIVLAEVNQHHFLCLPLHQLWGCEATSKLSPRCDQELYWQYLKCAELNPDM